MTYAWELEPDIEVRVIKGSEAKFLKMQDGQIVLVWNEEAIAVGKILRTLPISDPWRYLIVYDAEGNEVGIIVDIKELDPASQEIVREELESRYHIPKILRIPFGNFGVGGFQGRSLHLAPPCQLPREVSHQQCSHPARKI